MAATDKIKPSHSGEQTWNTVWDTAFVIVAMEKKGKIVC